MGAQGFSGLGVVGRKAVEVEVWSPVVPGLDFGLSYCRHLDNPKS